MARPRRSSNATQIQAIRRSLAAIEKALKRLGRPPAAGATGVRRRRRRLKLSPQRLAALKLQGRYMGYLRNLKPRQKTQVKTLKASKGFPAAISLAKRLAKG